MWGRGRAPGARGRHRQRPHCAQGPRLAREQLLFGASCADRAARPHPSTDRFAGLGFPKSFVRDPAACRASCGVNTAPPPPPRSLRLPSGRPPRLVFAVLWSKADRAAARGVDGSAAAPRAARRSGRRGPSVPRLCPKAFPEWSTRTAGAEPPARHSQLSGSAARRAGGPGCARARACGGGTGSRPGRGLVPGYFPRDLS